MNVSNTDSVTSLTTDASRSDRPPAADAPPEILLAEDDPVTRMLMTRLLKKAGYTVDAVADGAAALDKMIQHYYPILITDWEMPEMDGVVLCKKMRDMRLDGYVYALLLTARDTKEHIIAGLEAGADDYLIKPVHEPELIARLNTGRRILALESSLRVANQQNLLLSITDALTGAYNRRYLIEQLSREIERCRRYAYPFSVLMCDIDHFKAVNDRHGHAAGDEVLVEFVERIRKSIRSASDWVARYGGEEFVIVLPETPHAGAMYAAEKIRLMIGAHPFVTLGGEIPVTSSFGVASTSYSGPDIALKAESLMNVADRCLYRSKHDGRNRTTGCEIGVPEVANEAEVAEPCNGYAS
jgi:diguanylate cyclase (GGDEF)-like protein